MFLEVIQLAGPKGTSLGLLTGCFTLNKTYMCIGPNMNYALFWVIFMNRVHYTWKTINHGFIILIFFLFYSRNVTVNLIYHYKFKLTVLYIQSNNGTINLNLLVMQRATHNYYWHCIDIHFPTSYRYHLYFLYEVHVYELISNVNENILNSFCSCNNPIKLWLTNE